MVQYFANLNVFSDGTTIWPPPEESMRVGRKLLFMHSCRLASMALGRTSPAFTLVGDENFNEIGLAVKSGSVNGVLKREFSSESRHVFGPFTNITSKQLKQVQQDTRQYWEPVADVFDMPRWILQPTIEHLQKIGEVRAFVIGGYLICRYVTAPLGGRQPGLSISQEQHIRPSHSYQCV